jgi:hypothetical protein
MPSSSAKAAEYQGGGYVGPKFPAPQVAGASLHGLRQYRRVAGSVADGASVVGKDGMRAHG